MPTTGSDGPEPNASVVAPAATQSASWSGEAAFGDLYFTVQVMNHWASLLNGRNYPSVELLTGALAEPSDPDSLLFDFRAGNDRPQLSFIGANLAPLCEPGVNLGGLVQAPDSSLKSWLLEGCTQVLSSRTPKVIEGRARSAGGHVLELRGVLFPYSGEADEAIEFVHCMVTWRDLGAERAPREAAVAHGSDSVYLLEEADQLTDSRSAIALHADGPEATARSAGDLAGADLPELLGEAKRLVTAMLDSEARSRRALYRAVACAYDFALAAADKPDDYARLLYRAALSTNEHAPLATLTRLVFGDTHDPTRLAEISTAIAHGLRLGVPYGGLEALLVGREGGLKGLVFEERRLRHEEAGRSDKATAGPGLAMVRKLRRMPALSLAALPRDGSEITLILARRDEGGRLAVLGEVSNDASLVARAARKFLEGEAAAGLPLSGAIS